MESVTVILGARRVRNRGGRLAGYMFSGGSVLV